MTKGENTIRYDNAQRMELPLAGYQDMLCQIKSHHVTLRNITDLSAVLQSVDDISLMPLFADRKAHIAHASLRLHHQLLIDQEAQCCF